MYLFSRPVLIFNFFIESLSYAKYNRTHFFSPPSKQSAAASSVYRSKGHDDDDFSATTRSKTNVVSASAGLNEATCAIKSQFVCAVKHKQAAVGAGKEKKKKKKAGIERVSRRIFWGDLVQTSPLEEKTTGAIRVRNCKTLNPFISRTSFIASVHFCIQRHPPAPPHPSTSSLLRVSPSSLSPLYALLCSHSFIFFHLFLSLYLCLSISPPSLLLLAHGAEGSTGDRLSIELSQLCPL